MPHGADYRAAEQWLVRNKKMPKLTEDGNWWRWVLPDPSTADGPADLPKEVFDRLPGGDAPNFPWLYETLGGAMAAAAVAVSRTARHRSVA